ncbi:hypothetical protein PsorP6_005323 [Peronosclerospora sorghi]|uniref:Uncharacterized protein n=1 Tax=Peronosclerospora sorghi TaxID=230839 RepID=A0ACC0W4Y9_9STRA|nr:hypothetical protein PsorP6_005323 [Peronosclerospora sorghi]
MMLVGRAAGRPVEVIDDIGTFRRAIATLSSYQCDHERQHTLTVDSAAKPETKWSRNGFKLAPYVTPSVEYVKLKVCAVRDMAMCTHKRSNA